MRENDLPPEMRLVFAPPPTDFAQMHADLGWGEITPPVAEAALAASRFAVTLWRGNPVAGFGRHIVNALVDEIEQGAAPVSMIILMAASEKEGFYDRLGFTRRLNAAHGAGTSRLVGA